MKIGDRVNVRLIGDDKASRPGTVVGFWENGVPHVELNSVDGAPPQRADDCNIVEVVPLAS